MNDIEINLAKSLVEKFGKTSDKLKKIFNEIDLRIKSNDLTENDKLQYIYRINEIFKQAGLSELKINLIFNKYENTVNAALFGENGIDDIKMLALLGLLSL